MVTLDLSVSTWTHALPGVLLMGRCHCKLLFVEAPLSAVSLYPLLLVSMVVFARAILFVILSQLDQSLNVSVGGWEQTWEEKTITFFQADVFTLSPSAKSCTALSFIHAVQVSLCVCDGVSVGYCGVSVSHRKTPAVSVYDSQTKSDVIQ